MSTPARKQLRLRARDELRRWCTRLPPEERAELGSLLDRRADHVFHQAPAGDRCREWHELPIVLLGQPIDAEIERENRLWTQQLAEYVNAHEEVGFFLQERRFHICRAHAVARAVIARGTIPAGFTCPRAATDCPLASAGALAGGARIDLRPRVLLGSERREHSPPRCHTIRE
jgi:hypothetical protein